MIVALDSPHLTQRYQVVANEGDDVDKLVDALIEEAERDSRAVDPEDLRRWVTVDGNPWP